MDGTGGGWYHSRMATQSAIPAFTLFGETGGFPEVVHCERVWDRARLHDWTISPHRHHDMAQAFVMREGRARVQLDGRAFDLTDGQVLFVPALFVHGFRFAQGTEGVVLSFTRAILSQGVAAAEGPARHLAQPFAAPLDPGIDALCARIQAAFAGTGPFRASLLIALSHALLVALAQATAQAGGDVQPPARRRLADLDRLVARHMGDGWGSADYAAALAVTPGHLNRLCQAALGASASRHIESLIMTEARRLLAFTRLSVAEVGYRLGFADPSYFSRRFRAAARESPSAYRDRFLTAPERR